MVGRNPESQLFRSEDGNERFACFREHPCLPAEFMGHDLGKDLLKLGCHKPCCQQLPETHHLVLQGHRIITRKMDPPQQSG